MCELKVGCRYLMHIYPCSSLIQEVIVKEIAKQHIKLEKISSDGSSSVNWHPTRDLTVIELLSSSPS